MNRSRSGKRRSKERRIKSAPNPSRDEERPDAGGPATRLLSPALPPARNLAFLIASIVLVVAWTVFLVVMVVSG